MSDYAFVILDRYHREEVDERDIFSMSPEGLPEEIRDRLSALKHEGKANVELLLAHCMSSGINRTQNIDIFEDSNGVTLRWLHSPIFCDVYPDFLYPYRVHMVDTGQQEFFKSGVEAVTALCRILTS